MQTEFITQQLISMLKQHMFSKEQIMEMMTSLVSESNYLQSRDSDYNVTPLPEIITPKEYMVRQALAFTLDAKDRNGKYLMSQPHHWYAIYKVLVYMGVLNKSCWKEMEDYLHRLIPDEDFRVRFTAPAMSKQNGSSADIEFQFWILDEDNKKVSKELRDIAMYFYNKIAGE